MGYHKVDDKKFSLVKTLLGAGVKAGQIQEIAGISNCTLNNIRNAVDIEDYQEIVRKQFVKKRAYDKAKVERELGQVSLDDLVRDPKINIGPEKSYTVTMVINVDEEHEKFIAPLTALINNMFTPNDVAVEVNGDD